MTDTAWNHLFSVIEILGLAWIGYLTSRNRTMNVTNSEKLDGVIQQTNGMSKHLVNLTAKTSHAEGIADEKRRVANLTPLESVVGPDRLHSGSTDRLA